MFTRVENQPYLTGGTPGLSTDNDFSAGGGGPIPRRGEIGHVYLDQLGYKWQRVKNAAVNTQAAVASNVFYWTLAHGFVIDTDLTDAEAGINGIAGVFGIATAGYLQQTLPAVNQLFWALQSGPQVTVNTGIFNFTLGSTIIGSTVGIVTGIALATAPSSQKIGTIHTPINNAAPGVAVIDLDIDSRYF